MLNKPKPDLTGREYNEHGIQIFVVNFHINNKADEDEYLCIRDGEKIILTKSYLKKQIRIPTLKKQYKQRPYSGEDLSGKQFNCWEVLKYVGRNKNWEPVWLCKCICGSITPVTDKSLTSSKSKTCGCYRRLKRQYPNITLVGNKYYMNDIYFDAFTLHSKKQADLTGREYIENKTTPVYVVGFHGRGIHGENEWLCLKDNKIPIILTEKSIMELERVHLPGNLYKRGKYPKRDLVGVRFKYWMVVKFLGRDKNRNAIWLCECSCGKHNQAPVLGINLEKGVSTSCGCLKRFHAWCPSVM